MNIPKTPALLTMAILLASCGGSSYRHHVKQKSPPDIKISNLDLSQKQMLLRFEYRSYISKEFKTIECETAFENNPDFLMSAQPNITFDSFSTETLTFENINPLNLKDLEGLKSITYKLNCEISYNNGKNFIQKESVLHLVPGSTNRYR